MRHIALTFLLFLVLGKTFGRDDVPIQMPITVSIHQKSLHETFALISQQSGIIFSYNPQEINTLRMVSLHVVNKPLDAVLKLLLGPAISFKQHGLYIILTPAELADGLNAEKTALYTRGSLLKSKDSTLFSKKIEPPVSGKERVVCHSSINSKNDEQMKKQIAALLITLTTAATASEVSAQPEEKSNKPFQISVVYPLGTDGINSSSHSYNTSINIIGGSTGGVQGFEVGGIFNKNTGITNGAQFAGVLNLTQHVEGAQLGGIANISKSANSSAQFAGIINAAKSGETAIQMAGVANASQSSAAQIAGVVNLSDTAKVQASGVVNIARKSKVQVGLVNISEEADVQVGLVNISKNGFMEVELAGGEFLHTTASFRSGTNRLYGIISLGYNFDDEFWGYGIGFGKAVPLTSNMGMNLEGIHYSLATKKFKQDKYNGLVQLRPIFYYKLTKNLKLFAGPVANLYIGNNTPENQLQISVPYSIWDDVCENTKLEAWVGFTAGVRF